LLFLAAALAGVLLIAACSPRPPADPDPEPTPVPTRMPAAEPTEDGNAAHQYRGLPGLPDQRLTIALAQPEDWNLNPFKSGRHLFPVDPWGYYQPLYQTLLQYDPVLMDYVPVLAEKVRYEAGILSIILPEGGQWQDGFPLTSEDVLFSIQANRKYGTEAGEVLNDLIAGTDGTGRFSLEIHLNREKENAGLQCMDALTHLLILPEHHWKTVVSHAGTWEQLQDQTLPLTGSGPWTLWRADEFALSFVRTSKEAEEAGQPVYLCVLKYSDHKFSEEAFLRSDLGLVVGVGPSEPAPAWATGGTEEERGVILGGERLTGITVNPSGDPLLQNRSFRRLLGLAADRADAVMIPSTGAQLNGEHLASLLLGADDETISRLAGEAGLSREHGALYFSINGQDLPPLSLTFPDGQARAGQICENFAEAARELGIMVSLKRVSPAAWKQAHDTGNYALIYTETDIDESVMAWVARLQKIPGITLDQNGGSMAEFDGRAGGEIMTSIEQAHFSGELKAVIEKLAGWIIREGIFFPLAAEEMAGGYLNREEAGTFDLSSIFALKVRVKAPALQP